MGNIVLLICNIITGICSIVAIVISILVYLNGLKRETEKETIKELSKIRRKFYDIDDFINHIPKDIIKDINNLKAYFLKEENKKEYSKLKMYFKKLENFAIGVNEKLYDVKIVNKMSGRKLCHQYNILEIWIDKIVDSYPKKYQEFRIMINNIKKIRSYKNGKR